MGEGQSGTIPNDQYRSTDCAFVHTNAPLLGFNLSLTGFLGSVVSRPTPGV